MKFISDISVKLIQNVGNDATLASAAWVSTSAEEGINRAVEKPEGVPGVLNYLMKHRHGTPFEHASMTFVIHAPIFVWREFHRHRIGFCLAGDTEIWTESLSPNCGRTLRKRLLSELYDIRKNGVKDTLGRVRFLPSVKNQKLRVLNEETGFFELGGIEDIICTGEKECLLVETQHKKEYSIKCSTDHKILTDDGWMKAGDLTGRELIAVNGKKSAFEHRQIPPSLRAGIGVWTSMQRQSLILEIDICCLCNKDFKREDLILDHIIPVVADLQSALRLDNLQPICYRCHRKKTNEEQVFANRCNLAAARFVRLLRKPKKVSSEVTYDISMSPPHHNFVANGIVVHNSYNEESGRYKTLDPVFYIPPIDRPMFKIDEWKPGRPKFLPILNHVGEAAFNKLCSNLKSSYKIAYEMYQDNLNLGIDPGLARDCLPVGIYSSCWVTCNPRSLMNFLSLRTHEETAKNVSYPLYEIEVAARKCEEIFKSKFPITYAAFNTNGRTAP